nr:anhydro-N-acetylmuramic acid kinase [Psychrobacter sp. JCM 18901]
MPVRKSICLSALQKNSSVYVCGGGALNDYLMTRLQAHLPHCTVKITEHLGLAQHGRGRCFCMVGQTNIDG